MTRRLLAGLACVGLLTSAAYALRIALPIAQPVPQRVTAADTIIVGKVTAVEEKTVKAVRFQGDAEKGEYRVFTVKIETALKGGSGLTHIKVGCLIPVVAPAPPVGDPALPQIRPTIRPIRPFPIQQPPMLEKGQEVLLFLRPHMTETFYTLGQLSDVIDKKAGNYTADAEMAKKVCKLLGDPMTSLKSKESEERFLTAALLVMQYRTQTGPAKEEEISAEESKLIMQGLASGNFDAPRVGRFDPLAPTTIFYQLQPQTAGFVAPMNFQEQGPAMKKWLEDNASKFRIKRFVANEKK